MIIVRPCRFSDLPGIEKLVNESPVRLTTLSTDREKLAEKLDYSCRSFGGDLSVTNHEQYLFVLENTVTKEILGTSGIEACAGNGSPFYNYRLEELIHSSQALDVYNELEVLYLTHELTGSTRLCSLSIAPAYRDTPYLKLLSCARFMFMRLFPEKFNSHVIVEIQGVQNSQGISPFWESLGRHFFGMDFDQADYYSSVKSKTFIAEMMPPQPIYVPLLTLEAQKVISQPHKNAQANFEFLRNEGFELSRYVDIFDGGPTLEAQLEALNTARSLVHVSDENRVVQPGQLVCSTHFADFRATLVSGETSQRDCVTSAYLAEALGIDAEDDFAVVADANPAQ